MSTTTFTARILDPHTGLVSVKKVDGESAVDVREALVRQGLTPLAVQGKARGLSMEIPGMTRRVKAEDLAVFSRMFATMIGAGMPVVRSLTVMTNQTENPTLKLVLEKVTQSVQGGKPLSAALGEHPETFPPLMVNLIRAGEVGGFLDVALVQVADSTEADVRLRSEIKSASAYPLFTLVLGLLGSAAMLIFIVPVFASMFTSLGGELPLVTRIVMGLSNIMKVISVPLIPVAIAGSVWWSKNKNTDAVRRRVDPLKLRLPVFGPLVMKIAVARFARNLSVMLTSGVPILEALSVVSGTAGNVVVQNAVADVAERVKQGAQMSEHLGDSGVFPEMVVSMIAVGEESGATDTMLSKIAEFYDEQVESTTKKLASLIEPLLIVTVGSIFGFLIVAMYMPTFQIFNLIK